MLSVQSCKVSIKREISCIIYCFKYGTLGVKNSYLLDKSNDVSFTHLQNKIQKDIEDKVISLNDSATWELFKKLVSE